MEHKPDTLESKLEAEKLNASSGCDNNSDMEDKINDINYNLALIDARIGSKCLQFAGITLQSLGDTGLFVNNHVKSCSFEFFLFGCLDGRSKRLQY